MAYYGRPPYGNPRNGFVNQGFQGNFRNPAPFYQPQPQPNPSRTPMIAIAMIFTGLILLVILGAIGAVVGISLSNFSIGGGGTPASPTQGSQQTTQTTTTTVRPTTTPTTPTTTRPTTTRPTTTRPTTTRPTTTRPTTNRPTTAKPATTARPATTAKPTTAKPTTVKPTTAATVEGDILNTGVCGTQPVLSRIIGGSAAQLGHWPWIGSLQVDGNPSPTHACGATLLNQNWAITASHCFDVDPMDPQPPPDMIRFGFITLSSPEAGSVTRSFTPYHHPSYSVNNPNTEYDITLLKLNSAVTYTDNIRPICLATLVEETEKYSQCKAAGWGARVDGNTEEMLDPNLPDVLEEVNLPIIDHSNQLCGDLPDILICAGQAAGGIDACQGDSGGPLICKNTVDSSWHLVGIVSSGEGCGQPNKPGLYTRVTSFVNNQWIINTINTHGGP